MNLWNHHIFFLEANCFDSNMQLWWFIICFFFFLSSSSSFNSHILAATQSICNHQAELSTLLNFKDEFVINCTDHYGDDFGYPKTYSWNINGTAEWDGVECDVVTGHVIGLDLSSSCLRGTINSNSSSSIFSHLVHLEHLNLAYNNFNGSTIPSELGNLWRLTYLNLSYSYFAGRVPLEISKLSMLTSLDLSYNDEGLEMNLKSLFGNLTNLEEVDLSYININSEVPKWLFTNMSSLRSLKLDNCGLKGEFPQVIFHLPKLQHLSVRWNEKLEGHLPTDFNSSTTPLLESILLKGAKFRGTIPVSIGNLVRLRELDLSYCEFSGGHIPASLGNLTQLIRLDLSYFNTFFPSNDFTTFSSSWLGKLTSLRDLEIAGANLTGEIPPYSFENLTNLSTLDLYGNKLTGKIPSTLSTQLAYLLLAHNQLTGEIPSRLVNLTKLVSLRLNNNTLHGPLPIQNLRNLLWLDVSENNLSDTLELDMFLEFKDLKILGLSSNNLTLLQQQRNVSASSMLPSFDDLGLSSCRLSKFPEFFPHQQELRYLDLSYNNIEGSVAKWMGSIKSIEYIDLSHNFISIFDDPHLFLQWPNLRSLDISFNKLQGSVPIPSPSVESYRASNNELNGEIPHSFCNLTSLVVLDLSTNRLTGELNPYCFYNNVDVLNLRNNSFQGKIPELCTSRDNYLKMVDLNTNQFQGKIPKSLANCEMLEFFDIGSNSINDTFPYWLGSLPQLKVFILKDNAFHGSIRTTPNMSSGYWFPKLIIIDVSQNNLSGNLTSWPFDEWISMKTSNLGKPNYTGQYLGYWDLGIFHDYSLTMNNKGMETNYPKVLDALVAINLSSNEFEGEIPTAIGNLQGLRFLNLSNNHLFGFIPSSLGDLIELESLDFSSNRLSGQLPQQLIRLNFLSVFNVSHNNLTGRIPQGRHFDTFSNISYLENPGLCGVPLSRKCGTSAVQLPDEMEEEEDAYWKREILWMVVAIGFGGGLVVGVAVENMADWRMLIILSWRNWRSRGL